MPGNDTGKKPSLGRKPPSGRSKNTNSGTGSKTGRVHPSFGMTSEREANTTVQSTGQQRPVQEMGATVDNSR